MLCMLPVASSLNLTAQAGSNMLCHILEYFTPTFWNTQYKGLRKRKQTAQRPISNIIYMT